MVEHGEGLLETPAIVPSPCCLADKDPEHLQATGLGTLQGGVACRGTQLICTTDTVGQGLLPSKRGWAGLAPGYRQGGQHTW